jgi:hypothetical protein
MRTFDTNLSQPKENHMTMTTDEQLGPELAKIVNHQYVISHQGDDAGAGLLWQLKQQPYDDTDFGRILGEAIANPGTPPDLRAMVVNYVWPQMAPKREVEEVYGQASDYAHLTFRNSVRQLLGKLGRAPEELAAEIFVLAKVAELDQEFIDKVDAELAKLRAQDAAKEEQERTIEMEQERKSGIKNPAMFPKGMRNIPSE